MTPQDRDEWPEHAVCAKCGASLEQHYHENPVGLRFCSRCFEGTVREKARERDAEVYLQGRCSNCNGSLINGYRLSKLGVVYCIPCHESLAKSDGDAGSSEQPEQQVNGRSRPEWGNAGLAAGGAFWLSFAVAHLLLFLHFRLFSVHGPFLPHPASFFRGVICLDILTLAMLFTSKRLPAPRFVIMWTLLLAAGFIILVAREVVGLMQ